MRRTFNALGLKYQEHKKSEFVCGRKTYFPITNKLTTGMHIAQTATWKKQNDTGDDEGAWEDIDIADDEEEVEEQGDLEVDD